MGADMYLNPPADPRGPENHVVIDSITTEVWGPYRKGAATSKQRALKKQYPFPQHENPRRTRFVVRKLKR